MIPRKILAISSAPKQIDALADLFKEMAGKGHLFRFACAGRAGKESPGQNWNCQKIYLGPEAKKGINTLIFFLILPFLLIFYLPYLAYHKFAEKISLLILFSRNEKIIFTPLAGLLKIKTVWIEPPEYAAKNYGGASKLAILFFKAVSRHPRIITFNGLTKSRLKNLGWREENIFLAHPGIKINRRENQDDIFSELAKIETKFSRKFFTIGVQAELSKNVKMETIMSAVKSCLPIIPNLQLIVVGEGEEKKNLSWLAKKMGLDTVVWFVSARNNSKKWLANFNIFVMANENPTLGDLNTVIKAMAAGLPVIGPANAGLEEIVYKNKTGALIETDNSEMLARQIIKLYQDKRLRLKIGELGRERAETYFTLEKQLEKFEEIFE